LPRLLIEDDVARARRVLVLPEELQSGGHGLTELVAFGASVDAALYEDDPEAIARALALVPAFEKSPLLVVRIWHSDTLMYRVRALLGGAAHAEDAAESLAVAKALLSKVESLGLESHVDQVRLSKATVAHLEGDRTRALELLDAVLLDADILGDDRYLVACARLRKGELLGGDVGRDLVNQAERTLRRRGVRAPTRFARVFAPGWRAASGSPVTDEPEGAAGPTRASLA
jgi:hypothetical protein